MNIEAMKNRLLLLAGPRLAAMPGAAEALAREIHAGGLLNWRTVYRLQLNGSAIKQHLLGPSAFDNELLALIDEWAAKYRPAVQPLPDVAPTVTRRTLNKRTDELTAVIERAIKVAGSDQTATVYNALREIARDGEPPFTGLVDDQGLAYADTDNKVRTFTLDALRKRLTRRKTAR